MRECASCGLKDRDLTRSHCLVCGGALFEGEDPRVGTILAGRYRLEGVIGEGGMATVYRARHTLMERPYAVKILHRDLAKDEKLVERMRREGRSAAGLTHPNIVEVYDFGIVDDGSPFLVMELLDGSPLRDLVSRGPMPFDLLVELATQIAHGLARAHDFGVVHRDLKPENVFVCDGDEGPLVKLVDFGIARSEADTHLTKSGEVMGTPQYMAPERATSRDATPSCDLYSLGVMLFEMASGVLPFESNTATGFVLKHMHEAPRKPSSVNPAIDRPLEALILELLAKDPADRPVDVHQVLTRLQALRPAAEVHAPTRQERSLDDGMGKSAVVARWKLRADILNRLVERAYPDGHPPGVVERLASVGAGVGRVRTLQENGVGAQREIDALEREAREGSERLGHAVHVLAKDLSRAREEARSAGQEATSRANAGVGAKDEYHHMLVRLEVLTQSKPEHPGMELVEASRAVADAAEGWRRADEASQRSVTRAERSAAEVQDLDFQLDALRGQLEKLESAFAERGRRSREVLEHNAEERLTLEARLAKLLATIVTPLRERAELREIFVALEAISPTTEPLPMQAG